MRFLVVPRRARLRWLGLVMAAGLAIGATAVAPGVAGAQQCPEASPTYFDACGPTFVSPPWGDAGGWTDPSKYSTIQLADVNGDGRDELIARNDQGLEIFWFDTTLGQWRPQVDANGVQEVLTDFRSPLPTERPTTDWTKPQYYSTIQAADVDGQPGEEILARFADGMRVYQYSPPAGSQSIDGGSWARIGIGGPFSDAAGYGDPSLYPTIQVARFSAAPPALFARQHSQAYGMTLVFYTWSQGGTWTRTPDPGSNGIPYFSDDLCGSPSCYLTLQAANAYPNDPDAAGTGVIGHIAEGLTGVDVYGAFGGWNIPDGNASPPPDPTYGPFADVSGGDDCPFTTGSSDCLGSSPSYYETQSAANVDGNSGDEVLARASDGLRVKHWVPPYWPPNGQCCFEDSHFESYATLSALAGAASSVPAGLWGSIRTGDINKDGRDEVLALDAKGLQAWSYDPTANAWSDLQPSTPLVLAGSMWQSHPEYYSTLRVGDVDGDGRDDVVARGQFGIRTWFYDRRGSGGWERYLDNGYQAFPGTATTGQQGAFNKLNALALEKKAITTGKVRDVWTGENRPDPTTPPFSTILTNLAGPDVGNCSGETILAPPTYASCALPADMSGYSFTAGEWTAVVNELLREAYLAQQVVGHFDDLETMRQNLFEGQDGEMAAIGADLQLAAAAGNTTDFDLQSFFAGLTGVTASIAGVAEPEISAGLWVASEVLSMLPSASPTANSSFQTTYAGLLDKMATARSEMEQALKSQSQQVRTDQGLLGLVGQLRSQGTWVPNIDGIESTSREAFVLETYQALVPTVFDRYQVTNCIANQGSRFCQGPSAGPGVIGNSQNFTTIGLPPTTSLGLPATPCIYHESTGVYYCHYETNAPPADLMSRIWGPVSPTCNYQPGNANTAWTFGCNLGVPAATSVGTSPGWAFATHAGNPVTMSATSTLGAVRATAGVVRASAARAGSGPRASREVLGPLRFRGRVFFARGLRLRRMRVSVQRTLFEHGRREELARSASGRRLRPFALRRVRDGVFTARRRGGPGVRLRLRRLDVRGGARLELRLTRVRTRDIRALCTVLPASVSPAGRPLELETRLQLRDRAVTHAVTMRQRWRCVRDRKGEFTGIRPIKPRRPAARPGLSVGMTAPRVLASGRRASVRITVANLRRARPTRVVSSLWDLRIAGTAGGPGRTIGVKELRARRSRTLRLTLPVPRRARGRVCVQVAANATSARGAGARRCARIANAPRVDACAAVRCTVRRTATPLRAPRHR